MIQTTGGIVKDGVIVPDRPLPDNAYVEIIVPNAPREIVDRVRWGTAPAQSVSESGGVHVVIDANVPAFLQYHNAEQVFAALLEWIRSCFPEVVSLKVELQEDHDERGWIRVFVWIRLPAAHSLDLLQEQKRRFYDGLGNVEPPALDRLFVHQIDFAQE